VTREEIERARRDAQNRPGYLVLPNSAQQGGSRPVFVDRWQCPSHCGGQASAGEFWSDSVEFFDPDDPLPFPDPIPVPPTKDRYKSRRTLQRSGTCELWSTLYEYLFCKGNTPFPDPPCPKYIRQIGTWLIAVNVVSNGAKCQVSAFRPFHRVGKLDPIVMDETQEFDGPPPSESYRSFDVSAGFVKNFDPADMTITGPSWLRLAGGWLAGRPPATGQAADYAFSITASNPKGTSDPLELRVSVQPKR
jgi:hypothetical protein